MQEALERIDREFTGQLAEAGVDANVIEALRVRYLGGKGELTAVRKSLGGLSKEARPAANIRRAGEDVRKLPGDRGETTGGKLTLS